MLFVGDIVFYQGQYYQVVAVRSNGRMVDLKNNRETINQVYASNCEKINS